MTTLTPLNPVPAVSCAQVDILAPDAGRTEAGLVGTVQICNGRVLVSRLLHHTDPADRRLLATEGADASGVDVEVLLAGILDLSQATDVALRQAGAPPDAPEPWPPLILLAAAARVPEFPLTVLQGWLRTFVEQFAESTQTPTDLAGMLVLAVLSAAIGGRVVVQVGGDWTEQANLYVAVFLPSGERKSAVFREATKPIEAWEEEAARDAAPRIAEAHARAVVIERQIEAVKAQIGKVGKDAKVSDPAEARDHLATLYEEQAALPRVVVPRITTDDATPEALAGLLYEQNGRIALLSAEGGPIDDMAGRYSDRPYLNIYLKGHSGDRLIIDRRGRPPEINDRPAMTIGLSPQPDVLPLLRDIPGAAGRGLLARFSYSVPVSRVGERLTSPSAVKQATRTVYAERIKALLNLAHQTPHDTPLRLTLAREAAGKVTQFLTDIEPRLGPDSDLGRMAGWANKLAGSAARLAALLHCAEYAQVTAQLQSTPISGDTMQAAINLARDYLLLHAKAAFGQMATNAATPGARRILACLERHPDITTFKKSWLWERVNGQTGFERAADLDDPLALLGECGYIRERPPQQKAERPKGGRPPSPTFDVNPTWDRTVVSEVSDATSLHEEDL